MTQPRVSVIIPTHNSAWSVGRTLASVLHQKFTDFEVLIVDDGSTDDFAGAIAPYLGDARVRAIAQENRGLAGARNRGIAEAKAALIAPIDADDLWHPDFLEAAVAALDQNDRAPFAYAYSFKIDEEDRVFPYISPEKPPRHDFLGLLSLNSVACGSAAVFRRDRVLRCGCYDEEMRKKGLEGAEDWKLTLRLAREGQPVLIERALVGYRHHYHSMSQSDPRRQFRAVTQVIEDTRREMPDVSRRALADARTMMTAWLLPAFARQHLWRTFVAEAFRAYVLNPAWFANPMLRRAHRNWVRSVWRSFAGGRSRKERTRPYLGDIPAFHYLKEA